MEVNGAGKSTLVKPIMGFVPVARGRIRLPGMPVRDALRQNLVTYVPQADEVNRSFPVLVENLGMMGRCGHRGFLRCPAANDSSTVDEALSRVGLVDLRQSQIGEQPGGQKKRVLFARALAQAGRIVLLDDPFTGADLHEDDDSGEFTSTTDDERPVVQYGRKGDR